MEVLELDGPRGGAYYLVDLVDGRRMAISRKRSDNRVWLGRPDDPTSWSDQRGGIGTISELLERWRARVALDPEAAELYQALSALVSRKGA